MLQLKAVQCFLRSLASAWPIPWRRSASRWAPRATPHDMRRTFATTAARLGFPDALIHRVLNHPGKVVETYNQHKYEQESRRLMEAVANKLTAIVTGTDVDDNVVEFRK